MPKLSFLILSIATCSNAQLAFCKTVEASVGEQSDDVPQPAIEMGYITKTFNSHSDFSNDTVDQELTYHSGFKWYNSNIVRPYQPPSLSTLNDDGTLNIASNAYNLGIVSAANISAPPRFVGTAFGGGGYFEAEIKFKPEAVNVADGWPSFWAASLESTAALPQGHWENQTLEYLHTVEVDIFEYMPTDRGVRFEYNASAHEFYGVQNVTCRPEPRCEITSINNLRKIPAGTDFQEYHKVAMRWVPATAQKKGTLDFYFDNVKTGTTISWDQFNNQPPPVYNKSNWAFGIVDKQHLVIILGSGKTSPMTIRSVRVWQRSGQNNYSN